MKKTLLLCFSLLTYFNRLWAQNAGDAAVQINAITQAAPAQITLNWLGNSTTTQYQVYRKLKSASFWGSPLATLSGTINQYVDNAVSVGTNYEYRVIRTGTNYSGFGYINSGIEIAATDYRGKVILLVDSTHVTPLASEIKRLVADMEGDGWTVIRHDVDRSGSVYHVKSLITDDYARDSAEIKAVFILGHVPVPYSGNINPDGHGDHLGAWPADVYYGDVDGIWTDQFVTSTTASPARTQNVPGDGKFDQSVVPSDVELQVGRVDFNNMPAFTLTEQQLLKNYLDKDHDYRKKLFVPVKRAVVDDNFGYFSGEAFAASGYKTFGAVVGTNSVTAADYITSMTGNSYLWSYGCGGGTYTSASGIGTTANLASANLQGVFTMLFGSYFGDWDSQNNFLKAPLAQGKVLTNVWAGRPHYQFHHMGLGENIGYDLLQTQNNPGGLYYASPTGITGRWIHNALMGDPTLRNDVLSPVSNVVATRVGNDCYINWSASTETNIVGYNIYVRNDSLKSYVKINSAPVAGTTYTDNCLVVKGVYSYMVRTLKLETTPSGTYYNMSEGIADTAYNTNNYAGCASFNYSLTSGNVVNLFNLSTVATTYQWDFDNGATSTATNPVVTYANNGVYNISLIAGSACLVDTAYQTVVISEVGLDKLSLSKRVTLLPNPTHGKFYVSLDGSEKFSLSVIGSDGRVVFYQETMNSGETVNLEFLPKGIYLAEVKLNGYAVTKKLLIE